MMKSEHMTLLLNSITLQNNFKHKLLILINKNNFCLHNQKTRIININLHTKNIVHIVTEQITLYPLVSKNNATMKTKEMPMLDQNLLKSLLYSTFVLLQMIELKDMIHAIKAEVHQEIIITKVTPHRTDIVPHLEIDSVMIKVLLLHNILDHDLIITKEIRDLTVLLIELLIDHHIDMTLVPDIDHALIQETIKILQNTLLLTDHLQDHGILETPDHVHIPIQEINLIQYNHNPRMNQLTLKYVCTTQLKWQML